MTAPDLRPLAMGEIIDRSATFWRAHFKTLFQLYLAFELIVYGLTKAATLVAVRYLPYLSGPKLNQALQDTANLPEVFRQMGIALAGLSAIILVDIWVGWWISVAGTRYCVGRLTGEPVTLADGFRRARERTGRLTRAFLLSGLMWLLALVICSLPGAGLCAAGFFWATKGEAVGGVVAVFGVLLIGLGLLASILWYVLRFMVTAQVIAVEDVGARAALARSSALLSGRIGQSFVDWVKVRATILLTAILIIRTTVGLLASLPALIVQFAFGHPFDPSHNDPSAIPQLLLVPAELFNVVAQSAFSPLYLAFAAFFYLDMRVRREGLDLELKLGAGTPKAAA